MRLLLKILGAGAAAAVVGGCLGQQTVKIMEFYEPNKDTLTRREDGYAVGAIKSETVKSGSRDEGDRDFAIGLVNLTK